MSVCGKRGGAIEDKPARFHPPVLLNVHQHKVDNCSMPSVVHGAHETLEEPPQSEPEPPRLGMYQIDDIRKTDELMDAAFSTLVLAWSVVV